MKLSPAMRSVLKACIDAPPVTQGSEEQRQILHYHCVPVRRLVDKRVREGASVGVARASISRTLHRLFKRGLVDLQNNYGNSFTERLADRDRQLTEHERDPEAAYQRQVDAIKRGAPGFFPFTNADGYLAWTRRHVARRRSEMRATWIQATDDGLRAVNCYSDNS